MTRRSRERCRIAYNRLRRQQLHAIRKAVRNQKPVGLMLVALWKTPTRAWPHWPFEPFL